MNLFELKTERLLLRPFKLEDASAVFSYATDPEWGQFLPIPDPYLEDDAVEYVRKSSHTDWKKNAVWALVPDFGGREGLVSGAIHLEIDDVKKTAELGYAIARSLWGYGLVPEGCKAVLRYAFKNCQLLKVDAFADVSNERSWHVMESLGMERVALRRRARPRESDYVLEVGYSITVDLWEENNENSD